MTGETQRRAIVAEYLAGAKYRDLHARYHISIREVIRTVKESVGPTPRFAREAWMQQRIAEVAAVAGQVFGLRPGAIWGDEYTPKTVHARLAAWLVCAEEGIFLPSIGRAFEIDHAPVRRGRDQARALAESHPEFRDKLNAVRSLARAERKKGRAV